MKFIKILKVLVKRLNINKCLNQKKSLKNVNIFCLHLKKTTKDRISVIRTRT